MTSTNHYVLKKDIVIPAGTRLYHGPNKTTYHTPHLEVGVGFSPDVTGTFRIDLEEALDVGLVERG